MWWTWVQSLPRPQPTPGIHWTRTRQAGVVGNLVESDAMDETALMSAMQAGADAVDALPADTRIAIFGEMGIGNTTPASAVSAQLMGLAADDMVGPGTGVEGDVLEAKRTLVQRALDRTQGTETPLEVLRQLGGREIAAIVGGMGRAAERGVAILVDGFIVSSAALVATRHDPRIRDYMWFGHRSAEPGHARILEALPLPLVDAG